MGDVASFAPLWASPPGRTIQTRLDEIGLDVPAFAQRLGTSTELAQGLLDGEQVITIKIARRLAQVVGASVEFWVSRDCQYRDDLVRIETDRWLGELPVREMARFGWITPEADWSSQVDECLAFFGVDDLESWRSTYEPILDDSRMRISEVAPASAPAVAAWLRKATREADSVTLAPWSSDVLHSSLDAIRALTRKKDPADFLPDLRKHLAAAGVALVVVQSLAGCPASGAARFVRPDRGMIVVSGRFLADDQFWFTVMHEIGHLLLHRPDRAILDDPGSRDQVASPEEREANDFAAEVLVPAPVHAEVPAGKLTYRDVVRLGQLAGVSPGIVVGQLQHSGRITFGELNKAKRRYRWNGPSLESV
jgi:HTH-type transcriptional regulator/antitoxin HigA